MRCLGSDSIDTPTYMRIGEKQKRESFKSMKSEKFHWFTTKMNMRRTMTSSATKSWDKRQNSDGCEERFSFSEAENFFHALIILIVAESKPLLVRHSDEVRDKVSFLYLCSHTFSSFRSPLHLIQDYTIPCSDHAEHHTFIIIFCVRAVNLPCLRGHDQRGRAFFSLSFSLFLGDAPIRSEDRQDYVEHRY